VLFVTTDLRVGGQERKLVEIVRALDRERIRPVVACLKEPGELAGEVEAAGVPLHSRLIGGRLDARVLWRLVRLIRAEGVRVVCTVGCGDKMFWGRLAGWLARVDGIVSTLHKTRNPDGSPVVERPNRWLSPITDRFVAVARGAADYLVEREGLPREKMVVIHNGVDVERFDGSGREAARAELGLADGDEVVVHVAVLRPEKGHEVLLDAARSVVSRRPRARFLLVGEGDERARIEAKRDALGLAENVRLLGARGDVERILAAGDLAVLSSHGVVETFPNSVLEAMASGLPTVCTRVGSVTEMVADGREGLLVPPADAGALADAIERLLADPARRRAMGAAARERARLDFPRERMVRSREELFLELAGRRRSSPPA